MVAQKRLNFAASNKNSSLMAMMNYIDGFRKINTFISDACHLGVDYPDELLFVTLLHLYRFHRFDDTISLYNSNADVLDSLQDVCLDPSKEGSYYYAKVYDEIRLSIIRKDGHVLVDFLRLLSSISDDWFETYFAQLFDDILYSYSEQIGGSVFMQPKEFSELIFSMVDLPENAKIYDPFTGIASFALNMPNNATFSGQEINRTTYLLALLRMMAHGVREIDIHNEDSFRHWRSRTWQDDENITNYDFIVSFPPIGLKRSASESDLEYLEDWEGKNISLEEYFISNGRCGLYLGGQMAGIFAKGILFQGGTTGEMREELVRSGLINTVIELPTNLLPTTSIGLCAIFFNNSDNKGDRIRFVDATSFASRQGRRNVLKVSELVDAINSDNSEFVKHVSIEDVVKQNFILTASRYFAQPEEIVVIPEGFEMVPLGQLFENYKGIMMQLDECRVVKGRDLISDESFEPVSISGLEIENTRNGRCRVIDKDCIIVLRIGQLKPTIFRPDTSQPVSINSNVTALCPKENLYFPYIVSELRKEYVRSQFDARVTGVAQQSVSQNDLLKINILMPCDRQLQQIAFENEQRLIREQKLKSLEVDEYLKAEREKVFQMMSIRKHRIKPYLSGMYSNLQMILEEVEDKGILSLDYELDSDYTILDAIRNIKSNLDETRILFNVLTVETNIGDAESVDLCDFLASYSYNHTIPAVQFKLQKLFTDNMNEISRVKFNKENLKEVLDELIHNAEKHFIQGDKNAAVTLDIVDVNGHSCLQISNNGQPLPDEFDVRKAFSLGYHLDKEGTGKGLFRLKQICDAFGAQISLERDDKSQWGVNFYILFKNA